MIEKFWKRVVRRKPLSILIIPAIFLWLASLVYRLAFMVKRARAKVEVRLPVPVISVGNISVGGTGKTPIVASLSEFLLADGIKVGVVSSGYGRASEESVVGAGYHIKNLDADKVGDEVRLLAELLPEAVFSVHPVKSEAAARLVEAHNVDVVIVDDGFQHFRLHRDIDIVTYDAGVKRKYLRPFPYGLLREPMSGLKRADIIMITRAKHAKDIYRLQKRLRSINDRGEHYTVAFTATSIVNKEKSIPVKYLEDKHVLLFAGVGNFGALRKQVDALCADLDDALELDDHQVYDEQLLRKIKSLADKHDSDLVLTTGKDFVKVHDFDFGREFYYLNQHVDMDPGEEKLIAYLQTRLNLKKQAG